MLPLQDLSLHIVVHWCYKMQRLFSIAFRSCCRTAKFQDITSTDDTTWLIHVVEKEFHFAGIQEFGTNGLEGADTMKIEFDRSCGHSLQEQVGKGTVQLVSMKNNSVLFLTSRLLNSI